MSEQNEVVKALYESLVSGGQISLAQIVFRFSSDDFAALHEGLRLIRESEDIELSTDTPKHARMRLDELIELCKKIEDKHDDSAARLEELIREVKARYSDFEEAGISLSRTGLRKSTSP